MYFIVVLEMSFQVILRIAFLVLYFLSYKLVKWRSLENKLIVYADDTTLLAVVSSPQLRTEVVGSLNRDLARIFEWC